MDHDALSLLLSGSNTALLVWVTFVELREIRQVLMKHLADHTYLKDTGGGHG